MDVLDPLRLEMSCSGGSGCSASRAVAPPCNPAIFSRRELPWPRIFFSRRSLRSLACSAAEEGLVPVDMFSINEHSQHAQKFQIFMVKPGIQVTFRYEENSTPTTQNSALTRVSVL